MKKLFTLFLFSFLLAGAHKISAQCGTPANLQSSYSNNVSTFTWDAVPGATEYAFELDWEGGTWGFGETPVSTNSFSMTGLMQGGRYQWRVRANCNGTLSTFSTALFATPCAEPFGLTTTNIKGYSATLNWQQSPVLNNNNTGYSISYRKLNAASWIQLTNVYNNPTALFFNLTGIQPGTTYEWRVRRVCSALNSNYIVSQFTTPGCASAGYNAHEWINRFSLGTLTRNSGAEPNGFSYNNLSTNLVIGASTSGSIGAGFYSTVRNQRFNVFIDLNRNGSYADPGEGMITNSNISLINGTSLRNFSVSIPNNATPGATTMRVVMRRANTGTVTPCNNNFYGEVEDYNVNLVSSGNKMSGNGASSEEAVPEEMAVVEKIQVSPNPSSGLFTITLPTGFEPVNYEVTDMNGRVVTRQTINSARRFNVDLTQAAKGIYLIRMVDKDQHTQLSRIAVQ